MTEMITSCKDIEKRRILIEPLHKKMDLNKSPGLNNQRVPRSACATAQAELGPRWLLTIEEGLFLCQKG